jgi:hypothetical protein
MSRAAPPGEREAAGNHAATGPTLEFLERRISRQFRTGKFHGSSSQRPSGQGLEPAKDSKGVVAVYRSVAQPGDTPWARPSL